MKATRTWLIAVGVLCIAAGSLHAEEEETPSATFTIDGYRASFIGSGTLGGGTLSYGGKTIPFKIGGLGFGGIGIAKIDAKGEVYGLEKLEDFGGAYAQLRVGVGVGTKSVGGPLWVQNANGVRLKVEADYEGIILNLGADGLGISLETEDSGHGAGSGGS
jgi:hypothetical protein